MEKKSFKEIIKSANVIDVIAVILIIAVGAALVWKIGGRLAGGSLPPVSSQVSSSSEGETGTVSVTYVVRAEGLEPEVYENVCRHIPGQLMAAGVMVDAWVVGAEQEPAMILAADGTWVEDTEHVTARFTVEAEVESGDVMNTAVGNQEVRIGRPGYILKTEAFEIRETVVVDVDWGDWVFGAGREETGN